MWSKLSTDELCNVKRELKELKSEPQLEKTKTNHLTKNQQEESSGRKLTCRACDNSFDTKKSLKMHIKTIHPQNIKCKLCEQTFEQNCDLEVHIKADHEPSGKYKCDTCGKSFALRWRLGKHQESHTSSNNKKCHYFNNNKVCPFEEIGCMFAHALSETCIFGSACSQKLCSYQHEPLNSTHDKTDEQAENVETVENTLKEQFEQLTYKEQHQSKMIVCDQLCKASHGYHRCNDEDNEGYSGCDVFNITDEFDDDCNKTEYFPCEKCDLMYDEYDAVKEHYLKDHEKESTDGFLECDECDFTVKSVEVLIMHIGVKHNEILKKNLE